MRAVFKREMRAYFTSPLGYAVLAAVFIFAGIFFYTNNMYAGSTSLQGVFSGLFVITLLIVLPVLTMRLFSDERRQKTDQALLTAPVSITGIVLGKFFAALLVFAVAVSITLVYAVVTAFQVVPDWLVIFGNYLGLVLLGGLIISIGLLISSLTESQLASAIATFAVSFALVMVDELTDVISSNTAVVAVIDFLSVYKRYYNFTVGSLNYADLVFFLSMQGLFLFLTVRSLDRKRWS